jgi:PiT family inorganic phosphate transporter
MLILLFLATVLVAYSNGANDNFKGVATLYGSETIGYKGALAWATVTTFLGSVASVFLAATLLSRFGGKGLVPDALAATPEFMLAVALGTGITVLLATWLGFPISTTHAITGSLAGAGFSAVGMGLNIGTLSTVFFLPLIASPVIAMGLGSFSSRFLNSAEPKETAEQNERCICAGNTSLEFVPVSDKYQLSKASVVDVLKVKSGTVCECEQEFGVQKVSIKEYGVRDTLHFISSGMVSFARGLNDTPKIVAFLLVIEAFDVRYGMLAVGLGMAIGGIIQSRKIAEVMSNKLCDIDKNTGLTANLITSFLVIFASRMGVPVSTTHVSVSSIYGAGVVKGQAHHSIFGGIFASWVITLPVAAVTAGLVYWLI